MTGGGAVQYNFEHGQKLSAAFIGAEVHSFRDVYPIFQYAPIDRGTVYDFDPDCAAGFARQFGAHASYADHHKILADVEPDIVFIVTTCDEEGCLHATRLPLHALEAGCHYRVEKPTAASVAEVRHPIEIRRYFMTDLKETFFPFLVWILAGGSAFLRWRIAECAVD